MTKSKLIWQSVLLLAIAVAVSYCGGGGGGTNTSTPGLQSITGTVNTFSGVLKVKNGSDIVTINGTGSSQLFNFPTTVNTGDGYAVDIDTQPPAQKCTVTNGSGVVGYTNVTNVLVTCAAATSRILWSFGAGLDGRTPLGGLVRASDGNFYGTTNVGGAYGFGTVFRVTPAGVETVLWSFGSASDGASPGKGNLIEGADGNLYGVTSSGGAFNLGTVYKITLAGLETVLWSFGTGNDGRLPKSLIQGQDGNFYGVTYSGGMSDKGTIFKLTPAGAETVLYSFTGVGSDGFGPTGLMQASDGTFYGTTYQGGINNAGTVFKMTTAAVKTDLWSFGAGVDGQNPLPFVTMGTDGNLYGVTYAGGTSNMGTVFKLTIAGGETVLSSFSGGADGQYPSSSVIEGSDGNFYGTTASGGTSTYGTLYKITPAGVRTVLWSFGAAFDSREPQQLILGTDGIFYGVSSKGGANGLDAGTLFKFN